MLILDLRIHLLIYYAKKKPQLQLHCNVFHGKRLFLTFILYYCYEASFLKIKATGVGVDTFPLSDDLPSTYA